MNLDYDVIIVGAGLAGLGAAKCCFLNDIVDVLILESSGRVGGRVHSVTWKNQSFDLGAQWIHGSENPIYEMAQKHDLIAKERSEEGLGIFVRENGDVIDDELVRSIDFEVGRILQKCEEFKDGTKEYPRSVGDYLTRRLRDFEKVPNLQQVIWDLYDWHERFQIVDNSCRNLYELSAKAWGEYMCVDDEAHYNLIGGYNDIISIILGSIFPPVSIRYNQQVKKIIYGTNYAPVTIYCENGMQYRCNQVIVTVSLGILKNHDIVFEPQLPERMSLAIENMGFHAIGKVILIFPHKWWTNEHGIQLIWNRDTVLSGQRSWVRHITGFEVMPKSSQALIGWVGGDGLELFESLSDADVIQHCLETLRQFLPNCAIPEPIKCFRTNWLNNPHVRGSYSYISTKCDKLNLGYSDLSQPVCIEGRIKMLLAGEAVHKSHYSTTHGAYESGYEQANVLIKLRAKEGCSSKI